MRLVVFVTLLIAELVNCSTEFPILDLALPINELSQTLGFALENYGFFYVKNHGVYPDAIKAAFNKTKLFYQQSLDTKSKHSYFNNRGYIPLNNEKGQIGFEEKQILPDRKEGFVLMWPNKNINKPFYGKNDWPKVDQFKNIFKEYKNQMDRLNIKLIKIFSLSLNLSSNYFFRENNLFAYDQLIQIALWHYMPIVSDISNGIYAGGEHADWTLLSIIAIDDDSNREGLQVKLNDNKWQNMEYKENMLIINSGQMAQVITNGLYKPSYHRVILTKPSDRYSIVYFISPNYEYKLNCLPTVCNNDNIQNPKYIQDMNLNTGQFLAKMFQAHTAGYSIKQEL